MTNKTNKIQDISEKLIEIIPNAFYMFCTSKPNFIKNDQITLSFNIDQMFQYLPFNHDFGPLKISCIYQYVVQLKSLNLDKNDNQNTYWHVTSTDPKKYTNSILLICSFMVISLGKTPEKAYEPFKNLKFLGFRDASFGESTFQIQIMDCLRAIKKAMNLGWFDIQRFSLKNYQHYEKTQNGDINQIIKDKFFAFSSLIDNQKDSSEQKTKTALMVVQRLKKLGISVIIRFSEDQFLTKAINTQKLQSHYIAYTSNFVPQFKLVDKFLFLIQQYETKAKIGVTCETGLGKTGTMIGCLIIKKYGFSAHQAISWIRLCRPGSITGVQQQFLVGYEKQINKNMNYSPQNMKGRKNFSRIQRINSLKQKVIQKNEENQELKFSYQLTKVNQKINKSPFKTLMKPPAKKKQGFDINKFIESFK